MTSAVKNVAVLGSTGSIGTSALEVIAASNGRHRVVGLSAHTRLDRLVAQARQFQPRWVIATDGASADGFNWSDLPPGTELLRGQEGLEQCVRDDCVDIVLAAIVGCAGLRSTWSALDAKKTVALANKETLVIGGPLVMQLAADRQARILPVDSEHSAVLQALEAGQRSDVKRVVLTASGGPFRDASPDELLQVTVNDALAHPTWDMGPKITVDSATMMNKALEVIEARWLFGLEADQIDVVIHPQSIVHSLVEFEDGSIVAQLSRPDMKLPIQYALDYPDRYPGIAERLDWLQSWQLDFSPPDLERFPALELGHRCARAGGTSGAVLNAANEAAVAAFLEGELHYTEIVPACRSVLDEHDFDATPSLEELLRYDEWARREISNWVYA